jgi:hypothetical protein
MLSIKADSEVDAMHKSCMKMPSDVEKNYNVSNGVSRGGGQGDMLGEKGANIFRKFARGCNYCICRHKFFIDVDRRGQMRRIVCISAL